VLVGPVQIDELVTYEDENGHHWNFPHIVPPRLGIHSNGIRAAGLQAVSEHTTMKPFHEFAKNLDAAITWYREHIAAYQDLKLVFGTCQSSRDIVNKLKRFMDKDPKNYSGIKTEILHMMTFIDQNEHMFDEFEQDKKVFDKLIVTFKAKLKGLQVTLPVSRSPREAIIIPDDDDDKAPGGAAGAVHSPGFCPGDLVWYLDRGHSTSSLNNMLPQSSPFKNRVHDVLFEVVAVSPVQDPLQTSRGSQFAVRLRMDLVSVSREKHATLTKFVEHEESKRRRCKHYRPNLVKNWRNLSQEEYYQKYDIKDDEEYFKTTNFLYVVNGDELEIYVPPAPPAIPAGLFKKGVGHA
jgi:hypothetical protein